MVAFFSSSKFSVDPLGVFGCMLFILKNIDFLFSENIKCSRAEYFSNKPRSFNLFFFFCLINIFPGKYISDNSKQREKKRPATVKGIILVILYDIIMSGPACDGDDFKVRSPKYYYIIYYYYDKYHGASLTSPKFSTASSVRRFITTITTTTDIIRRLVFN